MRIANGLTFLVAAMVWLAAATVRAEEPAPTGWTFNVMPYVWLPAVNGSLRYSRSGSVSPTISLDAGQVLDHLNFAAMAAGEARKGRWLIATDYIYMNMGASASRVKSVDFNPGSGPVNISTGSLNAGTQTKLQGSIWTLVGGYAAVTDGPFELDGLLGFRYLGLRAKTTWQLSNTVSLPNTSLIFARSGSASQSDDMVTPIVGAKGRIRFGDSQFFAPYYADVGGAGSTFTWQASAGVGYGFGWGDVRLEYRYLYYRQSGNQLLENVSFAGPGLGVNFRF